MEQRYSGQTLGEPCPLPPVATVDPDILDQIPAQLAPWLGDVDGYEPNILRGLD